MKTFNIFPDLEKKFPHTDIQIIINEKLDTAFRVNVTKKTLEINRLFQLLNQVIQEFIIYQAVYIFEYSQSLQEELESILVVDQKAFETVIFEHGDEYEALLFLSMKVLFPQDKFKDERLTNLYYQLSNRNQ